MKIELIKETRLNGEIWYFVLVDGRSEAARNSLKEAESEYNRIVEQARKQKTEVLKSVEL